MEKYGSIFEDYNIKRSKARFYSWFTLMRRLIMICILIAMDDEPVFQTMFFTILSMVIMVGLLDDQKIF